MAGGTEGQGTTTSLSLLPHRVLDDDQGAGWRVRAILVSTPGVVDRDRRETHTPAPCEFVYPPQGGDHAYSGVIERGGRRATHTPSPFQFIYPPTGGIVFFYSGSSTGAGVNPKHGPLLLKLPPHWGEYYFVVGAYLI
jgi:hypothetical protein